MIDERAKSNHWWPALALFALSPVLGELVSAHLSPLEFFHPLRLAITLVPYGCGAIVARELVVRRRKGFVSLVLAGMAFGLLFEGIVTRVLFNPDWAGLGSLAGYGRALGFSWVLAVGIVHFQAMIGIVCPILIVEAVFPARRRQSWVSTPVLVLCCAAVPGWTMVMGLFVPYFPPLLHTLALIGVVAVLLAITGCIAAEPIGVRLPRVARPLAFGLVGGVGMTLIMTGTYMVPTWDSRPTAAVLMFGLLTIVIAELGALIWLSDGGRWDDRHRLAMVLGFLSFFLAFGILKDCEGFAGRSPPCMNMELISVKRTGNGIGACGITRSSVSSRSRPWASCAALPRSTTTGPSRSMLCVISYGVAA